MDGNGPIHTFLSGVLALALIAVFGIGVMTIIDWIGGPTVHDPPGEHTVWREPPHWNPHY